MCLRLGLSYTARSCRDNRGAASGGRSLSLGGIAIALRPARIFESWEFQWRVCTSLRTALAMFFIKRKEGRKIEKERIQLIHREYLKGQIVNLPANYKHFRRRPYLLVVPKNKVVVAVCIEGYYRQYYSSTYKNDLEKYLFHLLH